MGDPAASAQRSNAKLAERDNLVRSTAPEDVQRVLVPSKRASSRPYACATRGSSGTALCSRSTTKRSPCGNGLPARDLAGRSRDAIQAVGAQFARVRPPRRAPQHGQRVARLSKSASAAPRRTFVTRS